MTNISIDRIKLIYTDVYQKIHQELEPFLYAELISKDSLLKEDGLTIYEMDALKDLYPKVVSLCEH